jgi:molybdopterin molybdotransferase
MIPISRAIKIIKSETGSLGSESVRLGESVGRVLAEDIYADSDVPPFDRSQMDGFAVKAKDTLGAPVDLRIVGESAAGNGWHQRLASREAVRIMTGAPVPAGADAIQKLELASERNGAVTIRQSTDAGRYIVKKGAEIKRGDRLFQAGEVISEKMIASLAAFGYAKVNVAIRPTVSILGTGSEIVAIDRVPGRDQIRNSNSAMLKALCEQTGARATILPQTGDDLIKLKDVISRAAGLRSAKSAIRNPQSEILVLTGGVSVGKYDLTKIALRELGAEVFFEKVRLRPGKPTVFGRLNDSLVFGLPGNPVSAAVTFYLFVRIAILRLQGAAQVDLPSGYAILTSTAKAARERDTYLPATIETDKSGRLLATPLRWHGSSDFVGFAKADVLVFVPRGSAIAAGEVVRISHL